MYNAKQYPKNSQKKPLNDENTKSDLKRNVRIGCANGCANGCAKYSDIPPLKVLKMQITPQKNDISPPLIPLKYKVKYNKKILIILYINSIRKITAKKTCEFVTIRYLQNYFYGIR